MPLKRRDFLSFLSGVAGTIAVGSVLKSSGQKFSMPFQPPVGETPTATPGSPISSGLSFQPVKSPIPSAVNGIALDQQIAELKQFKVVDDLTLPEGFVYDVIAGWGDKVGDSRFGYNNDYLSFVETAPNEGYLTINFEYISAVPWLQSFQKVLGKSLPFKDVEAALKKSGEKGLDASKLPAKDALKAKIKAISEEALIDQGMGVISIRKTADGKWERTNSPADRRITGISGLNDDRYLKCTGAAKAVFLKKSGQGYVDKLGDRIIGTFANCAGGTTPWGTVLSGEENIQTQVPDAVYADGLSTGQKLAKGG